MKWKRITSGTNDSVYETADGQYQIRKALAGYGVAGPEWRLLRRDPDSYGGWEWQQTFRLLRDAKDAADAITRKDNPVNYPMTLSKEQVDAFAKGVNRATPLALQEMIAHCKAESNDYANPANMRKIYGKIATLLRNELKGWKRNPVKKKTPRKTNPRKKNPAHEIRELILYADNTAELQNQKNSIIQNLQRKVKRGVYDKAKAAKLWQYLIDNAVRHYNKEFLGGGLSLKQNVFTMADRKQAAKELEEQYRSGIHYGNNPVKKKTPRKKRVSKKRASNPRRSLKKSHLWKVFRIKGGNVDYYGGVGTWGHGTGRAILFRTKADANAALSSGYSPNYQHGLAPENATNAQILKSVSGRASSARGK